MVQRFGEDRTVQQGPEWLAELVSNPPSWLLIGIVLVTGACLALAVISYRRNGIDDGVVREMGENIVTIFAILISAQFLTLVFNFPYVVNVIGGAAIGVGLIEYVYRSIKNDPANDFIRDPDRHPGR